MGFSEEWDQAFSNSTHLSSWPWSDLVSLVMRHSNPTKADKSLRILELGCGAGANAPFFLSFGGKVNYTAVDGSKSVIARLQKKYAQNANCFKHMDFTKEWTVDGLFDLIIDRAALTCNNTKDIKECIRQISERLDAGGKYIGIDWYAKDNLYAVLGEPAEDEHTRTGFKSGTFAETGRVHFSDREHIEELLSGFELDWLQKKSFEVYVPKVEGQFSAWNFVASKKSGSQ